MKKAKLLYIVSLGHSGSTLLDLICGTIPNVFSMGEMHFLSWQLLQGEKKSDPQTYCSCGKYFDKCEFWSPILNNISEEKDIDIFLNPKSNDFSINRGIYRYKNYLGHKIINKLFQLIHFVRFLRPIRYIVFKYYKNSIINTWELYDKVANKSNCSYVVDSSKNIHRALLLKMLRPKDVKFLILKRDVKGVASSSHYGLNFDKVKTRTKKWYKFYHKRLPLYLHYIQKEDYLEVSYETLCESYNPLREDIAKFINFDLKDMDKIKYISPYTYHTVQGNPMRLSKKDVFIKYDERWKERLNVKQLEWIKKYAKIN
jgi:hypothetical protein